MIQATESTIQIQDVGAINTVDIPIRPGTIVVLVGDNGAGKSTAISAVTSAIEGKNNGLKPRDGKKSGKVRLPGVTVNFGARMTKTETGDVVKSYVVVEDGTGISKILKPGIKDPVAADKKRLEGVLEVIGARLDVAAQKEFLGEHYAGFAVKREVDGLGFVDTVKAMKLYLEEVARQHAVKLDECTGAIGQIGEVPPDVVVDEPVSVMSKRLADLTVETRDAIRARDAADAALKTIGESKGVKPIADIEASIKTTREFIAVKEAELKAIQESLEEARQILVRNEALLEGEQAAAADRERLRKAIDTAPTLEVIEAKQKEVAALTEKHNAAVLADGDNKRRAESRQKLAELKSQREQAEAKRDSVKALVMELPTLLHKALESVPGWTVDSDYRMCVQHRRGEIPFSELSPGEGTAKVCLLACQFSEYGEGEIPVVGLPQECFEGLDGVNRRLLLDSVQEHGLCMVTAECSEEHVDGIRVKVMA